MAKQGENIYQRKNGRWEGKYVKDRANGRVRYGYISGGSYEDVLRRKQEKLRELEQKGTGQPAAQLLVSDVSDRWMESRRGRLKETTLVKYGSILKNHILPAYGGRQVDGISLDEIRAWQETLSSPEGRGMSAKGANSVVSVLRLIFQYARTYCGASAPELGELHMKQARSQIQILSHSEQELLVEYLMENMDSANLGIMTCLYMGIRLGEVCALQWGSIREDEGILDIHATMSRIRVEDDPERKTKIVITPPKSGCSVRRIPIPSDILRVMNAMRCADDAFFLTGSTEDHMDPRTLQNRFKAVLAKCGIAPVRFHALRHTFATNCIELDFDVKSLSEILGHANITITMNRYVHPTMVMKKDYMDRLSLSSGKNQGDA